LRYGLGIDIGTAYLAAAVNRGRTVEMVRLGRAGLLLPAIVRERADGSPEVGGLLEADPAADGPGGPGIGAHLFRRRLGDSNPILLGRRSWLPGELMTALLAATLERVAALEGGPPDRVVVTCPAVWGPYRREQFAEAVRLAGIPRDQVVLLTDAEAVVTYQLARRPAGGPEPVAVYDAGGSTFDATVIRVSPTERAGPGPVGVLGVPESLEWLGGVDLDDLVLRHLDASTDGAVSILDARRPDEALRLSRLRDACVRAREALSTAAEVVIEAEGAGPPRRITLTRSQLEEWVRPLLAAGLPTLRRALGSAGLGAPDLGAVLLVGGLARMPLVSQMVVESLGRNVLVPAEAQHCAALGAALVAGRRTARAPRF
jgi:molecular chaperone DnaK